MFKRVMLLDEADWHILKLANEKGKFAIQIGPIPDEQLQDAFERGIDDDLWTLVDVGPVTHMPGMLMRVFKLTQSGQTRRAELAKTFGDA